MTTGTGYYGAYSGGSLYFYGASSIQLNFLNFRGNKAELNPGNDITTVNVQSSLITSETMVGCTSTSASPRRCVYPATRTDNLLPNPTTSVTHVSCVATSFDSDTAEFTLTMSETITGTVLVQIDNSDGTRAPTDDQAPNIERVLSFSFDNTDSSSCRVPLGESGLVQEPISEYQVIRSSFVGSVVLSADYALDQSEENAFLTISGSGIPSGILSVTLSDDTVLDFVFQPHQTSSNILIVPLTGNPHHFEVGEPFPIVSAQSKSQPSHSIVIPNQIKCSIPSPSHFDMVSRTPNSINTFIPIHLSGSGLSGRYSVTLNSCFSFTVTAQTSTSAVSEELALGWPDSLAFDTLFTIQSIASTNPDLKVVLNGMLTFTTPPKPDPLSLFVDGERGEASRFCGESTRPCLSVEVSWEIVAQLGVRRPTIGLVDSATLGSPIRISNGMVALLSSFGNVDPTLRIPSSACEQVESAIIVVSSSTLEILDVEIVIDSLSPSFVLLSAQNSNLTLKEGSFVGPQSTPSSNDELSEDICSWTSGIVQLDNCTTSISDTKLKHLSFGAVNLKNGTLEVESSSFHDNSPNLPSFPSLRRNIHCSDGGNIEIGSLNGGDGTGDDSSAWIVGENCNLTGKESIAKASFFVPLLVPKSCNSSYTTKTKAFAITIVGTTLIPCGLSLEVFEVTKDEMEGQSRSFELNLNSTTSFSEKEIVLSLSESSLPTFSKSLEWRGRLVFGNDVRTDDSFLIQPNSSDRFSQSVKDNMKWWIPLLVSLVCLLILIVIVVIICWRQRKQNNHKTKKGTAMKEMDDEEAAQMEMEQKMEETIPENSVDHLIKTRQTVNSHVFQPDTTLISHPVETPQFMEVLGESGEVGMVDWTKADTLFDVLHRPEKKRVIDKKDLSRKMTKGLVRIWGEFKTSEVITRFSPRWVLVNKDVVQLRLATIPEGPQDGQQGTKNVGQQVRTVGEQDESFFGGRLSAVKNMADEGQRWRAPELSRMNEEKIDVESALVFSLGMVLWEVWTEEVPWKEMDEANAARQNEGGVTPNLKLVLDTDIRELITKCLSFDPKNRPSLKDVLSGLGEAESKVAQLPAHLPNPSDELDIHS
ncbi:hypothetical protein BLNAU_11378 [Blattamonas nauphoetae]|uniref:Protein kinase domain-containing protein n=1 Tax=Blattamonas nauphoetae TaxID=2049346 RepID=A0ABQ9XQJ1_9EUKA|nr:hypothetical protein BLNAU_11378 [Blattamonas nauphoetae]